ncbi:MAG: hypothetical protein LUH46_07725 [Alistipes sp.]|nr:hypothetical protein [Alistipes sp.]
MKSIYNLQYHKAMNPYERMTLYELMIEDADYFLHHKYNGGKSEFDHSINDISRARIAALQREKGSCFLLRTRLRPEERISGCRYTPYTGQTVYNFEFDMAVPVEDEELRRLVDTFNATPENLDMQLFDRIHDRMLEIDGISLTWV